MRTYVITPLLAGALALGLTTASFAATGQFKDMCAWGLANNKEVHTNCAVNASYDGKTYCFSSEEAKANFMKNPKANLAKAKESYKEFKSKS
jgi:YHS domain-containing protein